MRLTNEPNIRTGLERMRVTPGQVASVSTPTLGAIPRGLFGENTLKPFDAELIRKANKVDGYTRRSTSKYVSLILKKGWRLEGEEAPLKYITHRLDMMAAANTQAAWPLVLDQIVREFVEYANVFLVIGRTPQLPIAGSRKSNDKGFIGALFPLTTPQVEPIYSQDDIPQHIGWRQRLKSPTGRLVTKDYALDDIIHFWYCREPSSLFGEPDNVAAMQDIHDLRTMEESVLKLVFKHLNPLLHHAVPTVLPNGESLKSDIQAARDAYANLREGVLVTPGGHVLKQVGSENQAIRAEPYLEVFKKRVMAGLGVSAPIMGDSEGLNTGGAEALTVQMHTTVTHLQNLLSIFVNLLVINPLLKEGGFDPIMTSDDRVFLSFPEIETEMHIKEQASFINLYTNQAITREELRGLLGLRGPFNDRDFFLDNVQIPQTLAAKLGVNPKDLTDEEIKAIAEPAPTKDKTANKDYTKTSGAPSSVSTPANQHT